MTKEIRELSIASLDFVTGAALNLQNIPGAYHGPTINKSGTVGQGDTIDDGPHWHGDPTWGDWNGNLPGVGNWGN